VGIGFNLNQNGVILHPKNVPIVTFPDVLIKPLAVNRFRVVLNAIFMEDRV